MSEPKCISFGGIDGSGKSSQAAAVTQRLRAAGVDVVGIKTQLSATNSVFALAERMFGDAHAYHPEIPPTLREFVVASDVVQHYRTEIAPQLAAGRHVVWDRGPLCYESYARAYGADLTWVLRMLDLVPWPDITFLLDVDPDVAWRRVTARPEKPALTSERPEFLAAVREQYLEVAEKRDDVVVLDGERSAQAITEQVLDLIGLPCRETVPNG